MSDKIITKQDIEIKIDKILLNGILHQPIESTNIVLFVHGSGSSRFSPRNQFVAEAFNQKNLTTLLFDLLTEEEEIIDTQTREIRFNIPLLAARLGAVTDWLIDQSQYSHFKVGYFGASTGAAAALIAAAKRPEIIRAVVSRGGRPDLAKDSLAKVKAPTLLIVGGRDKTVLELNTNAQSKMHCEVKLEIIPEATHLFEEAGKLEVVTDLAGRWFLNKFKIN